MANHLKLTTTLLLLTFQVINGVHSEESEECKDLWSGCQGSATVYKCQRKKLFINKCKRTCGNCPGCYDQNDKCRVWADSGNCTKRPIYMNYFFHFICGICSGCKDLWSNCQESATVYRSQREKLFTKKCKRTCGKCPDIDECCASLHSCGVNSNCVNTLGSYTCDCQYGYIGDGKHCIDVDECDQGLHTYDANANCTNTLGYYFCTCNFPYIGSGNECYLESDTQPLQKGHCNWQRTADEKIITLRIKVANTGIIS